MLTGEPSLGDWASSTVVAVPRVIVGSLVLLLILVDTVLDGPGVLEVYV